MPIIKFTPAVLKKLPIPEKRIEYWDSKMGGSFGLRISPTGHRSWTIMTRVGKSNRQKHITIGNYLRISLKDARKLARETLNKIREGKYKNAVVHMAERRGDVVLYHPRRNELLVVGAAFYSHHPFQAAGWIVIDEL